MMMTNSFEYTRIMDLRAPTFDSLEQACSELGKQGWRVVLIDSGSTGRTATLEREIPAKPVSKRAPT